MSRQTIIFDKREVRSALPPETYQGLLCAFGSSRIDKVCSSLLVDGIELSRDMLRGNCKMESVLLRHLEPVNYLSDGEFNSCDEDLDGIDCRDLTDKEFSAVYDGLVAISGHVKELLPNSFYERMDCVVEAKPVNKYVFAVVAEMSDGGLCIHPKFDGFGAR